MREGFERLKLKSWFKCDRDLIDYAVDKLNGEKFKLWAALRGATNDFDGPKAGQLRVTLLDINDRFKWSQGKSSVILNGLIQKKFVRRIQKGLYFVARTLQEVQDNEHRLVQLDERKVHSDEVNVQSNEQNSLTPLSYKDKESSKLLVSSSDYSEEDFIKEVEEFFGGGSK